MPRPRSLAIVTAGGRRSDHDSLPEVLQVLVEAEDPALSCITTQVLAARMAGEDATDPDVLERCIVAGRAAHAVAVAMEAA